jgi:hypothetical protein
MPGMRPGPSRKVHYRIATSASAKTRRASAWAPVASVVPVSAVASRPALAPWTRRAPRAAAVLLAHRLREVAAFAQLRKADDWKELRALPPGP